MFQIQRNFKQATKALFIKYTVVPIIILFVVFFVFTYFFMFSKTIVDTRKASENILEHIQFIHEAYKDEIVKLTESEHVKKYLHTFRYSNLIFEEFYNFNNKQPVKSIFTLVDSAGRILLSTDESIRENGFSSNRFVRYIHKNPDTIVLDVEKNQYSHGKVTSLSIGKAIVEGGEVKGSIIIQLFEKDILNILFTENVDIAIITDEFENIVATTNELARGLMNKFRPKYEGKSVLINDTKYYVSQLDTPDHLFKIYTLKSVKSKQLTIIYFAFTIITGLILYFLVRILAEKMASKNVQSINKLVTAVQRLQQGDMRAYVDMEKEDSFTEGEFEYLYKQYNIMVNNLNQLMKRNEELARIRRVSEIKMLKAQFNPHFLFNVLETLRYTMLVDTKKAEHIIMTLSKLLRYSLDTSVEEIALEDDLDYTIDYLKLHKYRFNERLNYEFYLPENVKKAYVPKLILQPIIENALKYGYQNKMELNIYIFGKVEDDILILTVYDDGSGIEPDNLEEIRESLKKEENESDRIGLYNVHRRLKILYGEPFGLTINSHVDEGTEVELKMPYKTTK